MAEDLRTLLHLLNMAAYAARKGARDTPPNCPHLYLKSLGEICRATDKLVDDLPPRVEEKL
jgi:hypothetical protein